MLQDLPGDAFREFSQDSFLHLFIGFSQDPLSDSSGESFRNLFKYSSCLSFENSAWNSIKDFFIHFYSSIDSIRDFLMDFCLFRDSFLDIFGHFPRDSYSDFFRDWFLLRSSGVPSVIQFNFRHSYRNVFRCATRYFFMDLFLMILHAFVSMSLPKLFQTIFPRFF